MAAPRKILVVALDNLGDAVMASAVLDPLKRAFPDAFVGVWAKHYTAGLFDGHPSVDRVHAADPFWDVSPGRPAGRFSDFVATTQSIRSEGYDTALLLNTEWRRSLACWIAGIQQRIGYDRRHSRFALTRSIAPLSLMQHFVDDHKRLLEEGLDIALPTTPLVTRLGLSTENEREWTAWHRDAAVGDGPYAVAHLFSGDDRKNWPISKWLELMKRPHDAFSSWVVLLGPGEEGKIPAEENHMLASVSKRLVAPSLGLLKSVLANAAVVVDGDSGPGHVAAALGAPVVSMFGPTNPLRSRPLGAAPLRVVSNSTVVNIAVDEVSRAISEIAARV